jgi:hypothetical protein
MTSLQRIQSQTFEVSRFLKIRKVVAVVPDTTVTGVTAAAVLLAVVTGLVL